MNINEIIVGHRVLVQSGPSTQEHAEIKGFSENGESVIVHLSDGKIAEMKPHYIIKSFGMA